MGKVLGKSVIVLVYTRTVLKAQYKTQYFKDTAHFQLYYTQKQLSSIILGVIFSGCLKLGLSSRSRWRGQLPSTRRVLDMEARRFSGSWCSCSRAPKEQLRAGKDARQESAEMSAGISVRRSLLPKARMAGRSRSQAGMHWSLELALAVLYERCIHAL